MTHIPPFLPTPSSLPSPTLPSSPLPSLRSRHPLIQLGGLGERCKFPSGSGRSQAAKRYLVHFGLKNASGESNVKCTFTSDEKYVLSLDVILWLLLAFRTLLSKAVNRLPQIYNNKLKFPPFLCFCLPPYFTHDASCIMLNIDWTLLV